MTVDGHVSSRSELAAPRSSRTHVESAVILAAGEGSRLRLGEDDVPKPLYSLFGRTLIERALLRSRAAGVEHFVVVVGHQQERLRPILDRCADRFGVTIEAVDNDRWREGNGLSALAAEPYLATNEPFYLMMCDHVFPATFLDLLAEGDDASACAVVIDRDLPSISDLDEAMKVVTDGSGVRQIGKDLGEFDAVDTGVFLCRAPLFGALRAAQSEGDDALCAGVQRLADRGQARWVDSRGLFWQDIDTPADLELARAGLSRSPMFETDRLEQLAGG